MIKDRSEKSATLDAIKRIYGAFEGVCGISLGTKFSKGKRVSSIEALQFFVTRKRPIKDLKRPLPKYVLARDDQGYADRKRRIKTDVIELRELELCCRAGDASMSEAGVAGSIALLFRDRTDAVIKLLSCSHVISDLVTANQSFDLSGGGAGCFFQARSLFHTVIENRTLGFDIALAEVHTIDQFEDAVVSGTGEQLTSFGNPADLDRGTELHCVSRMSGARTIRVESAEASFHDILIFSGDSIEIDNLFACKGIAVSGDSGGIVYKGSRAVGIIVARAADDWVLIHSLEAAVEALSSTHGINIQCFD